MQTEGKTCDSDTRDCNLIKPSVSTGTVLVSVLVTFMIRKHFYSFALRAVCCHKIGILCLSGHSESAEEAKDTVCWSLSSSQLFESDHDEFLGPLSVSSMSSAILLKSRRAKTWGRSGRRRPERTDKKASQKAEEQKTRETKGKLSSASVMTRSTTSDDVRRRWGFMRKWVILFLLEDVAARCEPGQEGRNSSVITAGEGSVRGVRTWWRKCWEKMSWSYMES